MIEKIFYNIFILGSIISICILPILIFLSKKKYNYNIKNIYKIFLVILLLLFMPFNTFNFSKIKENLQTKSKTQLINSSEVLNGEESREQFQDNNIIIEFDYETSNDIKIENNFLFRTFSILPYIWLGICILLLMYNLINYLLFVCNLKFKNGNLDIEIKKISKDINLSKKVNCKYSSKILTPMTIGLINKKIILPEEQISQNECEHILRHELFHIKNKDIEYKFLLLLLNCIYWFNPIIYNFTKQANDILELNCDENVLQGKDEIYRIKYAETLLNQIEKSRIKQYSFSMCFANRKESIMNRFSNIVNNGKKKSVTKLVTILTILVILAIVVIISIPNINFASMQDQEDILENSSSGEKETLLNTIISGTNTITENIVNETQENLNVSEQNNNQIANSINQNVVVTNATTNVNNELILEKPLDEYIITARFGKRGDGMHTGLDLYAHQGTEIHSCLDGEVVCAGWSNGYGYHIIIKHTEDNFMTLYAHCSELYVTEGQMVKQGEIIATVGNTGNSTGPHLHLEVIVNGMKEDPMNYLNL